MKLSFIIVNYNTFELTCKCIESIIKITHDFKYEIIVVDNASSETEPIHFKNRFPEIHLIESNINLGFAKGNNLGIAHSTGEYICLINSDAEILKADFSIALDLLDEKDISFLTGKLIFPDGKIQHNCQPFPNFFKRTIEKLRLHKMLSKKIRSIYLQGFYFNYSIPGTPDWVWGTFMVFKKELLKIFDDDKLPDDCFMYGEDMEWCYLATQKRKYPYYYPEFTILHHMGGSSGKKEELISANEIAFIKKYYSFLHRFLLE